MEDPSFARGIALKVLDQTIRFLGELGRVHGFVHQTFLEHLGIRIRRHISTRFLPFFINLFPKLQRPIKGRGIVIDQLGLRTFFPDRFNHATDLFEVRSLGFDPKQIGPMFKCRDAIKNHPIEPGVLFKRIEPVIQAFRLAEHAILVNGHVPFFEFGEIAHR